MKGHTGSITEAKAAGLLDTPLSAQSSDICPRNLSRRNAHQKITGEHDDDLTLKRISLPSRGDMNLALHTL